MHRDLLDALRCPHTHEESWLVAMVHHAAGPLLVEAELACPQCGAAFTIRHGVADFGAPPPPASATTVDAERVAALLGVTGGAAPILLTGAYTRAGAALAALVDVPQLWLDAPPDADPTVPHLSRLTGTPRLPLGVDTLAAAAVDPAHGDEVVLPSIIRALRVGGRLLTATGVARPPELRELARDATEWVAEATTRASGLVELRRRV